MTKNGTPDKQVVPAEETAAADAAATPAPGEGIEAIKIDEAELREEIERLRAENERLAAARAGDSQLGRRASATVLIIIGAILFGLAVSAVWLNRTVMDEDRWVATVAPLAQDPAIQDYVADRASDAIITNVDIQGYVGKAIAALGAGASEKLGTSGALADQAQILVMPITGAIDNLIRESATKIVRSEQFYNLWVQMNRYGHKAFIAAISDKSTGVVQKSGGTITLETAVLVDQVKQALAGRGLGFVNNINIPLQKTQITLVDSPGLERLGIAIQAMNTMAYLLPLLALACLGGGVALAVDRRKAVLWVGIGITAAMVIPLEAIYFAQSAFVKAVYDLGGMPAPAAQAAYTLVFRNLVSAQQLFTVVGLVFVVGALLAGPSRFATSLRNGFQHGISSIGPDWDFGPVGEWILEHQTGVRAAGIIGAVVWLLVSPAKTIATIVWLVVAVIVWVALVALLGRPRPGKSAEKAASVESTEVPAG